MPEKGFFSVGFNRADALCLFYLTNARVRRYQWVSLMMGKEISHIFTNKILLFRQLCVPLHRFVTHIRCHGVDSYAENRQKPLR